MNIEHTYNARRSEEKLNEIWISLKTKCSKKGTMDLLLLFRVSVLADLQFIMFLFWASHLYCMARMKSGINHIWLHPKQMQLAWFDFALTISYNNSLIM